MKESKYIDTARAWGKGNGYGIVEYVTSEADGEIYYLFDKSLQALKTGRPRFILVGNNGTIVQSMTWDSNRVMSLYRTFLRSKQS